MSKQNNVVTVNSTLQKTEDLPLDALLERERRSAYTAGFAEGRDQGFAEGYDQGCAEGHEKGLSDGKNAGFAEGKDNGFVEGQQAGYEHTREPKQTTA